MMHGALQMHDGSNTIPLTVDVPIGSTPLTASVHVGRQTFEGQMVMNHLTTQIGK